MAPYNTFIGIDIGKFTFVVAIHNTKSTREYENSATGIEQFIKDYQNFLPTALVIAETTGVHELKLLYTLAQNRYSVHRANTRKVKSSFGNAAKTDTLDAKALALYGKERADTLALFEEQSQQSMHLVQLAQRRRDLKQMLIAEKK